MIYLEPALACHMPKEPGLRRFGVTIEADATCAACPPGSKLSAAARSSKGELTGLQNSAAATKEPCSWFEIHHLVRMLAEQIEKSGRKYDRILALSTGGLVPAKLLAEELQMDDIAIIPFREKMLVASEMPRLKKSRRYLAVDDIYDSGKTFTQVQKAVKGFDCDFAFCMSRFPGHPGFAGRILNHNLWIVFPWEKEIR